MINNDEIKRIIWDELYEKLSDKSTNFIDIIPWKRINFIVRDCVFDEIMVSISVKVRRQMTFDMWRWLT
jgi:hypothetical protein